MKILVTVCSLAILASPAFSQPLPLGIEHRVRTELAIERARARVTNLGERTIVFDLSNTHSRTQALQPVVINPIESALIRDLKVITILPFDIRDIENQPPLGLLPEGRPYVVNYLILGSDISHTNRVIPVEETVYGRSVTNVFGSVLVDRKSPLPLHTEQTTIRRK